MWRLSLAGLGLVSLVPLAFSQPAINLERTGSSDFIANWPVTPGSYDLETTKTPEVPGSWQVFTGTLNGNGTYSRTLDLSSGREFLRLSLRELAPNAEFLVAGYLHGEGFGVLAISNNELIPLAFNPAGQVPNAGDEFVGPVFMEKGGPLVYFTMSDPNHPNALWKYDGYQISLVEGTENLGPRTLTNFNDRLYFFGSGGQNLRYLYWTNGMMTGQVARPGGLSQNWFPGFLFEMNGTLYAYGSNTGEFLRLEGDTLLYAGGITYYDGDEEEGIVINGVYYYEGYSSSFDYELFSYDGTETTRLTNLDFGGYSEIVDMIPFGNGILFSEYESGNLYFLDLTVEPNLLSLVGDLSSIHFLTELNGTAYFEANGTLYQSDGNTVTAVANVPPASSSGGESKYSGIGSTGSELLICGADNGEPAFWTYNGSAFTSVPVDANVDKFTDCENFLVSNGQLLFTGRDRQSYDWGNKRQHLLYDGSSVRKLVSPVSATADAAPYFLGEINGLGYFMADDGSGDKPYQYDPAGGLSEAPAMDNIYTGLSEFETMVIDNKIYYYSNGSAANSYAERGIWEFDGSQSQFVVPGTSFNDLRALYPVSGEWIIAQPNYDYSTGQGYRMEVITQGGTQYVDFAPNSSTYGFVTILGAAGGILYVSASDDSGDTELWAYDLDNGERRLADLNPTGSSNPYGSLTVQSNLSGKELFFFIAMADGVTEQMFYTDGDSISFGPELGYTEIGAWVSDGDYVYYAAYTQDYSTIEIYRFNFFSSFLIASYPNDNSGTVPLFHLYKNDLDETVLYFTRKSGTELVSLTGTKLRTIYSGPLPAPGASSFEFVAKIGDAFVLKDTGRNIWLNQGEIPTSIASFIDDGNPYRDDPSLLVLGDTILFAGANTNPEGDYVGSELWSWDPIGGFNLVEDLNNNPITLDLGGAPAGVVVP